MKSNLKKPTLSIELIRHIENLTPFVWPPAQLRDFAGWVLATDAGITRRANSVLPNHWTNELVPKAAIEEVERYYSSYGLPSCFKISPASLPSDFDQMLEERNYRKEGETNVFVISSKKLSNACALDHNVDQLSKPSRQWMVAAGFGDGSKSSIARRRIVERIALPRAFLLATINAEPVGAAVVAAKEGWTCVSGLFVTPARRGEGIGKSLMSALAGWASANSSDKVFLQVESDNSRAQALYERIGWQYAYEYHYRVEAQQARQAMN
jgi:GNAT superfamily N-acetyltransferase